jgi:hypothetical protein
MYLQLVYELQNDWQRVVLPRIVLLEGCEHQCIVHGPRLDDLLRECSHWDRRPSHQKERTGKEEKKKGKRKRKKKGKRTESKREKK